MASVKELTEAFQHIESPVITFDAFEGTVEVKELELQESGGYESVEDWEFPIKENNMLVLHTEDLTVKAQTGGQQTIIGFAHNKPEALEARAQVPYKLGVHTGVRRQVGVEVNFRATREVPIKATTNDLVVGDSAQPDGTVPHQWEGAGSLNNKTIVLKGGTDGDIGIIALGFDGDY